ncbi:MAG TPA: hypothetical protein DDX39_12395 [Bacteroidales bacterium]|nr:MAG: hypothetical protein A2W98_11805 [Bacteroidetes bacterium GWF2_33_38]OFY88448.1 MAG: hypothetical protein A2236_03520 [Bacteroidetes bacterium RIFOXYA2_FULL_33_7]HBF89433.1 hypothetical protein [Bacteroidales bacterium]
MKNLLHKIFANTDRLSKKEITNYLNNNNLTQIEIHKIEYKINNNNLNSDAYDGFSNNPLAIEDLAKLKRRYRKSHPNTIVILTLSAIFLLIAFLAIFYVTTSRQSSKKAEKQIEKREENNADKFYFNNEIASNENIQLSEKMTTQKTSKQHINEESNSVKTEMIQRIPKVNSEKADVPMITKNVKNLIRSNAPIYYMFDLKIVVYLNRMPTNLSELEQALDAKFENRQTILKGSDEKSEFEKIPYVQYLYETMELFSKNNYKSAKNNFQTIIQHYPDDINANFYLGLCYYHLKNSEKSIACFENVIQISINTFYEEAKWYKALSLKKMHNDIQSEKILNEIISDDGFYSERAKKLLNE